MTITFMWFFQVIAPVKIFPITMQAKTLLHLIDQLSLLNHKNGVSRLLKSHSMYHTYRLQQNMEYKLNFYHLNLSLVKSTMKWNLMTQEAN